METDPGFSPDDLPYLLNHGTPAELARAARQFPDWPTGATLLRILDVIDPIDVVVDEYGIEETA